MAKFPVDAPRRKVMDALKKLGFEVVREGNHISMVREDESGTRTPLTLPNHKTIKRSTLRTVCRQAGISRDEFLDAYDKKGKK